jgi:hypothetical protein
MKNKSRQRFEEKRKVGARTVFLNGAHGGMGELDRRDQVAKIASTKKTNLNSMSDVLHTPLHEHNRSRFNSDVGAASNSNAHVRSGQSLGEKYESEEVDVRFRSNSSRSQRTGPSLMPSPTKSTVLDWLCSSRILASLSAGCKGQH